MKHDTQKTFREIHGTVDHLRESMELIERVALDRTKTFYHDIPLRFLTPLDPQPKEKGNVVHLRLTPIHEFNTSSKYVAVSYTWSQPPHLETLFGKMIPEFRIWVTDDAPRAPKCPPLILHRALLFARKHLQRPLIWIDQECIIQEGAENDLEDHLQIMHLVYTRSEFTAVMLSQALNRTDVLEGLSYFMAQRTPTGRLDIKDLDRLPLGIAALEFLLQDTWFGRTWTFHERHCSTNCQYLIPVNPALLQRPKDDLMSGDDTINAVVAETCLLNFCKRGDLETVRRKTGLKRSVPVEFEKSISRASSMIRENFATNQSFRPEPSGRPILPDRQRHRPIQMLFARMEQCDNSILADRLTVLTNIGSLRWTLKSTLLRDLDVSYSTCVLVLVLLNSRNCATPSMDSGLEEELDRTVLETIEARNNRRIPV